MKNILFVLMAFVLVASCALQAPVETGSITLTGPRALAVPRAADTLVIRYVLTRDGEVIPLDEQPALLLDEDNALESITINGLLPGTGYKLALSVGYKPEEVLEIDYFGTSAEFSIAAGSNSDVEIPLRAAPAFTYLTSSGLSASATVVGSTVYVLDGNTLKGYDEEGDETSSVTLSLPVGVTVNSISTGKYFYGTTIVDELWLNTTGGIYRDASADYSVNLNQGQVPVPNVTLSGAVKFEGQIFGLYTGGGSDIGFVAADPQTDFSTEWYTLASAIIEYPDYADMIDGISTDIIKSIAVNEDNAVSLYYAVTALGTVMGSQQLKTLTDSPTFSTDPLNAINPYMMTVADGSSIEVVSSAGERVFVGTDTGLYTSLVQIVSSDSKKLGEPLSTLSTPVTGTANISFTALASYKKGTVVYTAAVTEGNDVIILKDDADVNTLDAASGVPENAKALFHEQGEDLYLMLTGTNGAVDYKISY